MISDLAKACSILKRESQSIHFQLRCSRHVSCLVEFKSRLVDCFWLEIHITFKKLGIE